MRFRRVVVWSGFLLLAGLVLGVVWLWTADLGVFKPRVERWVSESTGREFAIEGEFSVDLAVTSVVVAEGIRLQNADWSAPGDMVTVGRLEVHVDLWSLFRGPVEISYINVDDAGIYLERTPAGDRNWDLFGEVPVDDEPARPSCDKGWPVLLGVVDVDSVRVRYLSPERDGPVDLAIESLDKRNRADDMIELELAARIGDRELGVAGEFGTRAALRAGAEVRYRLAATLDTFRFESDGVLDRLPRPAKPALRFAASGPDIDDLTRLLGLGEAGSGDIDLTGLLAATDDGLLALDVEGNVGESEFEATGEFSDLADLERFELALKASGPDLGRILRLFGVHHIREAPFVVDLRASRDHAAFAVHEFDMGFSEARFRGSAQLPAFPSLEDASIRLDIDGPKLERFRYVAGIPGVATGPFSASFELIADKGGAEILAMDLTTVLARMQASGRLVATQGYVGTWLDLVAESDSLAETASAYGVSGLPDRPAVVRGSAEFAEDGIRTRGPVTLEVDAFTAAIDGLIATTPGIVGSSFDFDFKGPDLSQLVNAFAAADGVPQQAYTARGRLEVGEAGYRITSLTGELGSSELSFEGLIATAPGLAGSRFEWSARGPAFEELAGSIGGYRVRPGDYELSGAMSLQAERLRLSDVRLDRPGGRFGLSLDLGLPLSRRHADFELEARGADVRWMLRRSYRFEPKEAAFDVVVNGRLRGTRVDVSRFRARVGEAVAEAEGGLDFGAVAAGSRFGFRGSVPSLKNLGELDGRPMRDQSLSWQATVTGADGVLTLDDFVLLLGESRIDGRLVYRAGDVPSVEAELDAGSIVFAPSTETRETPSYDPEPTFDDGRLIPAIELPFEGMQKLRLFVDVEVEELIRDRLHLKDLALKLKLEDGVFDIERAGFDGATGRIELRAMLDATAEGGRAELEAVAREFSLGLSQGTDDRSMTGDINVRLASVGDNLRALAANANGVVFVNTRGGVIQNNRFLQAVYGDLLEQVISAINPFYTADTVTRLECVVIAWKLEDGLLTSGPNSFIRTGKINMASRTRVNLDTEQLAITMRTTPRRGISISTAELFNPFVQVVGTLASPRLAVNEQGVLVTGGAAVATGGLSILARAAWDRLIRSGKPCDTIARRAVNALGDRFPAWADELAAPAER